MFGDLLEDLLSQDVRTLARVLLKLDKLDDVSLSGLAIVVPEHSFISIELFHCLELLLADTNNDDGQGET